MLQTVEAEIDVNGEIRLLEPLRVAKKSRALVTLLENGGEAQTEQKGEAHKMLEFLQNRRLSPEAGRSTEEIEAVIEENRNSWE
jgi:hypothetical protein